MGARVTPTDMIQTALLLLLVVAFSFAAGYLTGIAEPHE